MMYNCQTKTRYFFAVFLATLVLAGCNNYQEYLNSGGQSAGNVEDTAVATFVMPDANELFSGKSIDPDRLYAIIAINSDEQRWNQSTPITIPVTVSQGETLRIEINWFESVLDGSGVSNVELLLASWEREWVIEENLQVNIGPQDYITTGSEFDIDNDNVSNLQEREDGTDPFTAGGNSDNSPTVRIPRLVSNQPPLIDGLYDALYDNNAQFQDVDGEQLAIDNRMIDQGAIRADGQTEFQWLATHDGIYLYLFILAENVGIANPTRDSTNFWDDDSLSVFIDGNNSKNSRYDAIDDRHFVIPLLIGPDNPVSNNTAIIPGVNSAPLPTSNFFTCLCTTDRHAFEVRIPLEGFGIQVGVPFGFDLQIDLDHDGGARDAKWSWFRPSVPNQDVDDSWRDTSVFGTVVLVD